MLTNIPFVANVHSAQLDPLAITFSLKLTPGKGNVKTHDANSLSYYATTTHIRMTSFI
jgi:hypothetical protein